MTEAITPYQGETIEFCTPEARLYAALARAQAALPIAAKDTTGQIGQNRGYKYADLASCWDAAKVPLKDNDLAVVQLPGIYENGALSLTTIIVHKDGGSVSGTMSMPVPKADPQGCGSAITYMRRYALCAALGIIQDDDDATSASDGQRDTAPRQNTPARAPERATAPVLSKEQIRETYTEYLQSITEATLKASDAAVIVGELTKDNAIEKIATYILTTPDMTVVKLVGMILEKKQQEAA